MITKKTDIVKPLGTSPITHISVSHTLFNQTTTNTKHYYTVVEGFINSKYLHLFKHTILMNTRKKKNSKLPVSCSIKNCLPSEVAASTDHCWPVVSTTHTTKSSAFTIFLGLIMSPFGKLVQSNQSTLVSQKS